jgi:hypothetical protein
MISADGNNEFFLSTAINCKDIPEAFRKPTLRIRDRLKFPINPEFFYIKALSNKFML